MHLQAIFKRGLKDVALRIAGSGMGREDSRVLTQINRVICGVYVIMTLRGGEKLLECLPLKLLKLTFSC